MQKGENTKGKSVRAEKTLSYRERRKRAGEDPGYGRPLYIDSRINELKRKEMVQGYQETK
jgi:hypothetical protein